MRRRDFIKVIAGSAAVWPFAAGAQQPVTPVVGFLYPGSAASLSTDQLKAFLNGLNEVGYVEGRNVTIDYRWAEDRYDRLPELSAELIRGQAKVIYAVALPAALAAMAATKATPVVFFIGGDPVATGLVSSLNRPSGNMTGVTVFSETLLSKRLELLKQLVPTASTIAVLMNPKNPNAESRVSEVQNAASHAKLRLQFLNASTATDFSGVLATAVQQRVGAMLVVDDPLFSNHYEELARLEARYPIPTIYFQREFVVAGGLISYATRYSDMMHQAGIYVGRILKGEKVADLPVVQPTKFELVINLKTATALGITVPHSMLVAADEVIE
jgi:putative ABC transport system substrate-binding protein